MAFNVRLNMSYSEFTLDVDLMIPAKGITAIFGPSGSGKTSLLRAIAGLHPKELYKNGQGHIQFGDQIWQSDTVFLPTYKRPIGYVFQESSLFEHLSIQQNLDYGQKRIKNPLPPHERDHIIDLLGISHLLTRPADKLSGGERQRVAIARALLLRPRLLLMDEPMASLDFARKSEILRFLERLKTELKIPLLYISHNAAEVTRLADHLIILDQGKIQQQGPIQDILASHKILNSMSDEPFTLLFGTVMTARTEHNLTEVDLGDALIRMPHHEVKEQAEIRLHLYAKDVSITLSRPEQTSVLNIFDCQIDTIEPPTENGQCLIHLCLKKTRIQARVSAYSCAELDLRPGQKVFAQIKAVSIVQ